MNMIANEINAIFRDASDRQQLAAIQARAVLDRRDSVHAEALELNAAWDRKTKMLADLCDGNAQMMQLAAHAQPTPLAVLADVAGDDEQSGAFSEGFDITMGHVALPDAGSDDRDYFVFDAGWFLGYEFAKSEGSAKS